MTFYIMYRIQQEYAAMKAKRVSRKVQRDKITTLPQDITETILCLLPIEEAARTSILSKEWRHKWTTIPKLVFSQNSMLERRTKIDKETSDMANARKDMDERSRFFHAINQVLLLRQDPIHEFTLSMVAHKDYFEIDQIMLHLSSKYTVKKLTLDLGRGEPDSLYRLPSSLFGLSHLVELDLHNIVLDQKPIDNPFLSLTSISMDYVFFFTEALLDFLSSCPSLTRLNLHIHSRARLGPTPGDITSAELFECLPMIEHLTIWGEFVSLILPSDPEELTTSLIHLKYLCLEGMVFHEKEWTFLAGLIKCSPNIEKIKISIEYDSAECDERSVFDKMEKYSNVWLEHLAELEIDMLADYEPKLGFVKFILVSSPNLEEVKLLKVMIDDDEEELEMLKILLSTPRESPVRIIVRND